VWLMQSPNPFNFITARHRFAHGHANEIYKWYLPFSGLKIGCSLEIISRNPAAVRTNLPVSPISANASCASPPNVDILFRKQLYLSNLIELCMRYISRNKVLRYRADTPSTVSRSFHHLACIVLIYYALYGHYAPFLYRICYSKQVT
jgi:hypothetical protein